jgi:uncharacterized RDD family membrane protein YckC
VSAVESLWRYHTFWPRVGAAFIDGLVLLPLTWILQPNTYEVKAPAVVVVLTALGCLIPVLYSVLLHAHYGQTWGKMAVGVKVMNVEESRIPTLWEAFLRDIGEIALDLAGLVYLVGLVISGHYTVGDEYKSSFWDTLMWAGAAWSILEVVTMLTNRKRRAIHDFIAGTVVVSERSSGP